GGPANDGVVRLLAIGDTGEGNEGQYAVSEQMSAKCDQVGGCDAVLVNGDNFYDNGVESTSDPQWVEKFEKPYDRPGLNGLPFYAVLGNHDYGPTSTGNKQAQIDYSALPVGTGPGTRLSAKWHMPEAYYDVKIEHVHLFGIDTVDFTSAEQENDMGARVTASSAPWKIVFGHHPRYTSGEHFWDTQLLGFAGLYDFQQAIFCSADIFMTGHDHDMEFIDKGRDSKCPETYFVVSGASSKTRDNFDFTPKDKGQIYYEENIEGFAYLEISANKLLFEFIDKTGKVTFTKTIIK
ncbi:MAG TPA: metallophosphoesterase, partial [Polyangiaceae bacterium]|nr:metallophosphoesterase [Polyangiaceae bacterium]